MNATLARGTKTAKITTLRATPGTVLLTNDGITGVATIAATKTGATLREVASSERIAPSRNERQSRIVITFTDGTVSPSCSSSQTWMTPAEPVAVEAPAAPLEVVTLDGEELTVEVAATEVATKAYRIGKLLRTWVLARGADSYDAALVAHITAANECYDGTATLRLTAAWGEVLINAAADMDREHKAAARAALRTLYALFA